MRRPVREQFLQVLRAELQQLRTEKAHGHELLQLPIAGGEYQPSLFDDDMDADTGRPRKAYRAIVTHMEDTTGDGGLDLEDIKALLDAPGNKVSELHGDSDYGAGDFRSRGMTGPAG